MTIHVPTLLSTITMVTSDYNWRLHSLCGVVQPGGQEDHEESGKLASAVDVKGRLMLKSANNGHKELLVQQESPKVTQHFRDIIAPPGNTP